MTEELPVLAPAVHHRIVAPPDVATTQAPVCANISRVAPVAITGIVINLCRVAEGVAIDIAQRETQVGDPSPQGDIQRDLVIHVVRGIIHVHQQRRGDPSDCGGVISDERATQRGLNAAAIGGEPIVDRYRSAVTGIKRTGVGSRGAGTCAKIRPFGNSGLGMNLACHAQCEEHREREAQHEGNGLAHRPNPKIEKVSASSFSRTVAKSPLSVLRAAEKSRSRKPEML